MRTRWITAITAMSLCAYGCSGAVELDGGSPEDAASGDATRKDAMLADAVPADAALADSASFTDAEPLDVIPADTSQSADADSPDTEPVDGEPVDAEPLPDSCGSVLDLNLLGVRSGHSITISGNTSATPSRSSLAGPSCLPEIGHAVVYGYTPAASGTLTVSLDNAGTRFDTVSWALSSCSPNATELGCSDNANTLPNPSASTFSVPRVTAGVRLYIVVAGFRTTTTTAASGAYTLVVSEVSTVPAGGSCDPRGVDDVCAPPSACIPNGTGTSTLGTCLQACNFGGGPVCPPGTGCQGRSGTPGVVCVPALPVGASCDVLNFPPNNVCAAPTVCNGAHCLTPLYKESRLLGPSFIDACALGAVVAPLSDLDDGHSGSLTLPFNFDFYGESYDQIYADTNGYAVLGLVPPADATFGPPSIGDGPALAPLWDDLILDVGGARLCSYSASGSRFVLEWEHAHRVHHPATDLSFELILNGGSNTVDFLYRTLTPTSGVDAPFANGLDAHVGVQSAMGLDFAIHTGTVGPAIGLRFSP